MVGTDRLPSLDDQAEMHYTNAVMEESLRMASLAPLAAPHVTKVDIQVKTYTIPKGTAVFPNLYHIMHDPEYWQDPEEFKPERFLDADGKFHHDERVIPFSTGKRYCIGQSLAEKEFFLFFSGILQAYRLTAMPGTKLPGIDINSTPMGNLRKAPLFDMKIELWE